MGDGRPSIDPTTNDVFVATGNIWTHAGHGCPGDKAGQEHPYGDAVLQLDANLRLISHEAAKHIVPNLDSDYGGTPLLYRPSGCSLEQSSTKNKDGSIYTYGVGKTLQFVQS